MEEVPQRDIPLVVEAARHHRTVAEHRQLVPQAIAEAVLAPVAGFRIGPVEGLAPLEKQPVPQAVALSSIRAASSPEAIRRRRLFFVCFISSILSAPGGAGPRRKDGCSPGKRENDASASVYRSPFGSKQKKIAAVFTAASVDLILRIHTNL